MTPEKWPPDPWPVEIVKIQKPLDDPDPRAPAMIFAEGRSRLGYVAMRNLPAHVRRALRYKGKVYTQAQWIEPEAAWVIGLIVGDRPW